MLQDDNVFFLEENCNNPPGTGNVFLNKRVQHNPHKWDCIGGVDAVEASRKTWSASINKLYDEETDTDSETIFTGERVDAISALWSNRHQAFSKF